MKRALIVEPDLALRCRLIRLLGRHCWEVHAVERLDEALAWLDRPAARLVCINEAVDDDAGYLLLFAIREHVRWRHARVIMVGKGDERRHGAYAAELGADDYLTYPFNEDRIRAGLLRSAPSRRTGAVLQSWTSR